MILQTPQARFPTLVDWTKSLGPDDKIARVVELLNQTNDILLDMVWLEGNTNTGNVTTLRTALPTVIWRKLYKGVPPSKSERIQITDTCGMLEARSCVDVALAELANNKNAFRLSEARAFVEQMNQTMAHTLFYGDADIHPERFMGLGPRYNAFLDTQGKSIESAKNILDAGGRKHHNTSIWLVAWGPDTLHGIFPKGSTAGLKHQDLGEGDENDNERNPYRALRDHWCWRCGLTVRDWRYVVRIANIDINDAVSKKGPPLVELMRRAITRLPSRRLGRPVFYASRTIWECLDIQAMNLSLQALPIEPAARQFETAFFGIPLRLCDVISEEEAPIVSPAKPEAVKTPAKPPVH